MSLSDYIHDQVGKLIENLQHEVQRARQDTSEDGIHDLRVAIRRLNETLRVFKDVFPQGAAKQVRENLRVAMRLAGDARNHDIARELMSKAKLAVGPEIQEGRDEAARSLTGLLASWNESAASEEWRKQLHV